MIENDKKKLENLAKRSAPRQTSTLASPFSEGVQVCRCAGGRFTLRHDDETNTRAGHVSRRKDPLPDKRLPSPRLSRKVCRCAGVQAEDLLSDMMMKQIQGQAMCPGEKIRSQTNVYPRLAFLGRCAGVQVCRRKIYSQT
jgi:hypothetical protein